jgi:S-(hydroxymethyl)glutathione dehydrogenase/alcohol dehydrogenase
MLLDLYLAGRLKLDELITHEYPLTQINQAYDDMLTGTVARGIITF